VTSNPLVGTWRLISWENRSLDGRITYPLGEDAVGYISYTRDGYVFVAMMRHDRAEFTAGDLLRASAEEKAHAAETYMTYCGRYEFHGDTVVHHVELSLFPNWVGVDQERLVEVRGNRLTVSTRPMLLGGIQKSGHLIWERV
jgi:Lipocalin-like domain